MNDPNSCKENKVTQFQPSNKPPATLPLDNYTVPSIEFTTKPTTKKQDGCFFVAKRQSHTSNGRHQKRVSSLEKCKEACKAQKDCKAIDWDPTNVKPCSTNANPKSTFHLKSTVYMLICRKLPFVFGGTNIIKPNKVIFIV